MLTLIRIWKLYCKINKFIYDIYNFPTYLISDNDYSIVSDITNILFEFLSQIFLDIFINFLKKFKSELFVLIVYKRSIKHYINYGKNVYSNISLLFKLLKNCR